MVASHALNNSQPDGAGELSERDAAMLDFERQWWKYAGAKEQAVREKFDMSSTRYYQVWYREPDASFCPAPQGGPFNLSNGIVVEWAR